MAGDGNDGFHAIRIGRLTMDAYAFDRETANMLVETMKRVNRDIFGGSDKSMDNPLDFIRRFRIKNTTGGEIPAFACVELDSLEVMTTDAVGKDWPRHICKQPDGQSSAVAFVKRLPVPNGERRLCQQTHPIYIALYAGTMPDVGATVGPIPNSWALGTAGSGYMVLGEVDAAKKTMAVYALGGGGTNLTIGKAKETIQPNSEGEYQIWFGDPPVDTGESGRAWLDWIHSGEQISSGKEVLVAHMADRSRFIGAECEDSPPIGYGGMQLNNVAQADIDGGWNDITFQTEKFSPIGMTTDPATGNIQFLESGLWDVDFQLFMSHDSSNSGRTTNMRLWNVTDGVPGNSIPIGIGRNQLDTAITFMIRSIVDDADATKVWRFQIGGDDSINSVEFAALQMDATLVEPF